MRIGVHAVGLLIVGSEVLDTRAHIVLLYASDVSGSRLTSHHRILRVVLEVTSAERVTHDVQGRSQQHIGTILLHLFTNGLANLFNQLGVPGRGQQRTNGEVSAVIGIVIALTGSVDTQSGRTVGQYHSRDS